MNFHKALIEHSPAFIIVIDIDGKTTMMNQAMLDALDYTKEEIIGKDYIATLIPEEHRDIVSRHFMDLANLGGPVKAMNDVIKKNGDRIHVEWFGQAIKNEKGECDFHYGFGVDRTKRLEAEKKLNEAFLEIKTLKERLEAENKYLKQEIKQKFSSSRIIGQSDEIKKVFKYIDLIKGADTSVLITGETGTGKEIFAEEIHYSGTRKNGPIIKVNCSAITETILESELFGHVKGAFSGAINDKIGRIKAAEGGTLFLDEIGDISHNIQIKLLRFLDCKEYERVGESKSRKADVRIISATNANLEEKIEEGRFRSDLFYRLKILTIQLPPLRERMVDIPLLVENFISQYATTFKKRIIGADKQVIQFFLHHSWPGNIRELKHCIEHACLLCQDRFIHLDDIPRDLIEKFTDKPDRGEILPVNNPTMTIQKEQVLEALEKSHWNKIRASQLLGVHRSTLYRLLDRYNIKYQ